MTSSEPRNYASAVPKLAEIGRDVLFGDVWERPGLSKRDRSLVVVSVIAATYRPQQLGFHLRRAIENGLTVEELAEAITQIAFYAGWPSAVSAAEALAQLKGELKSDS
jgi:4-carboxymuconolactone decarboxylase